MFTKILVTLTAVSSVLAAPAYVGINQIAADNVVYITSATDYCMIMPRFPHTDIGASEYPGGMQTFCSNPYDASKQGTLPPNFWSNVAYVTATGVNGQTYAQLTGCINPTTIDRLNPGDYGGQYDSDGGDGGQGNPQGSQCLGFNSYVELVEPAGNRACIRCCNDPADCVVTLDTSGCEAVVPGNYFQCSY